MEAVFLDPYIVHLKPRKAPLLKAMGKDIPVCDVKGCGKDGWFGVCYHRKDWMYFCLKHYRIFKKLTN